MLYQLPDGDWIRLESVIHIAVESEPPRLSKVAARLQEGETAFQHFKSYEEAVKCRDDLERAVNGV